MTRVLNKAAVSIDTGVIAGQLVHRNKQYRLRPFVTRGQYSALPPNTMFLMKLGICQGKFCQKRLASQSVFICRWSSVVVLA